MLSGAAVGNNFNQGLKWALRFPGPKWVWNMPDDHEFDPELLLRLLDREVDCVTPLCSARTARDMVHVFDDRRFPSMRRLEEMPIEGLYRMAEYESCGDAGILLRRRVLEATGPPWVEAPLSGKWDAVEDRIFSRKVRDAGFDRYVDIDNPIGHTVVAVLTPKRGERVMTIFNEVVGKVDYELVY
jgi:hypothetical protein